MVGPHEMVSLGYSNRTPWKTPRELDEDEIYSRLKRLPTSWRRPERAIFNVHVPPWESSLDTAFEVDEDLHYVTKGGRPHEIPTGSPAVRQIIEEVQPLLSLHGHIHESKGVTTIGRTVAINPGLRLRQRPPRRLPDASGARTCRQSVPGVGLRVTELKGRRMAGVGEGRSGPAHQARNLRAQGYRPGAGSVPVLDLRLQHGGTADLGLPCDLDLLRPRSSSRAARSGSALRWRLGSRS